MCPQELRKLLAWASAETCYGAFRALRALDENEPAVQGEHLNEAFWLHRVAVAAPPMVHMTTNARPEIVLFGEETLFVPPFPILAGDFTVTASQQDIQCTIARASRRLGHSK